MSGSRDHLADLTRVGPFEAEVIAARLRSEGIAATAGAGSVYVSLTVPDGVPVLVPEVAVPRARALLDLEEEPTRGER